MFLLQFGSEPVPKSISVSGGGDGVLWEPIIGIAVQSDERWILLEAGIGRTLLADPEALDVLYPGVEKPHALPGDPLESALNSVDLRLDDIALAAVSHLHCDHTGGVPRLSQLGVPIAVQRDELDFAMSHGQLAQGYYASDFAAVDASWRPLFGDTELAPGVSAFATPGHTPGHMSYRVDLAESGTWLFAIDAADLGENLLDRTPPGQTVGPWAQKSLDRLVDDAGELGARLVPGHDQYFWNAVRHPKGGHR